MIDQQWLAEQLLSRGLVSQTQLDGALRDGDADLCGALLATGAAKEGDLLKLLGLHFQTRYISAEKLNSAKIPQWVLDYLPLAFCEEHQIIPVRCGKRRTVLSVVTPDPTEAGLMDLVKREAGLPEVQGYIALPHAVQAAIRKFYKGDLHAFERMDEGLRQSYNEMLNVYEQRLFEFNTDEETPSVEDNPDTPLLPVNTPTKTLDRLVEDGEPAMERLPVAAGLTPTGSGADLPARVRDVVPLADVLVEQLEQSHPWRQGHSRRVSLLCERLASQAGMEADAGQDVRLAALLHELGHEAEPHLTVLSLEAQPDLRGSAEQALQQAALLLEAAALPQTVLSILAAQYERPDGLGFPGALSAEAVGEAAPMVSAVDAYVDLLSNPHAPGGKCEDSGTALRTLRDAANRGVLSERAVQMLAEVVSGDALRERLLFERRAVLVVDPDIASHGPLVAKLREAGLEVQEVTNTATAARLVLEEDFDLVICNTELEPVDGLGFLERLRADERTYQLPFFFVSEDESAQTVERAFELGAVDYVIKPYRMELVLAKLRQIIKQRTAIQPPRGVQGSLSEMSLPDIIQVLAAGKKSGQLVLKSTTVEGELFLDGGEVVHAVTGDQDGEEAFFALLKAEEGSFTFDSSERAAQRVITRSFQELMADAEAR